MYVLVGRRLRKFAVHKHHNELSCSVIAVCCRALRYNKIYKCKKNCITTNMFTFTGDTQKKQKSENVFFLL